MFSDFAGMGVAAECGSKSPVRDVLFLYIARRVRMIPCNVRESGSGDVLFRQGDEPVDCYVVMRGRWAFGIQRSQAGLPEAVIL